MIFIYSNPQDNELSGKGEVICEHWSPSAVHYHVGVLTMVT